MPTRCATRKGSLLSARENPVAQSVAVIGLGRFGTALALELERRGTQVMGVDIDGRVVSSMTGTLTHVVQSDAAQEGTAVDLALASFDRVVVSIGGQIVASCLASSFAVGQGAEVWAKANSDQHARILRKVGVHHVVLPEFEMGKRVAHLVRGGMLDYVEFDENYAMVMMPAPSSTIDQALKVSHIRRRHGVTVVAVKASTGDFTYASPETVLREGDKIIVSGTITEAERFSAHK